MREEWRGFSGTRWTEEINVREFIQKNYTEYLGDESFLEGPTEATDQLWGKVQELQKEERAKGGVLDMDTSVISTHGACEGTTVRSIVPSDAKINNNGGYVRFALKPYKVHLFDTTTKERIYFGAQEE